MIRANVAVGAIAAAIFAVVLCVIVLITQPGGEQGGGGAEPGGGGGGGQAAQIDLPANRADQQLAPVTPQAPRAGSVVLSPGGTGAGGTGAGAGVSGSGAGAAPAVQAPQSVCSPSLLDTILGLGLAILGGRTAC